MVGTQPSQKQDFNLEWKRHDEFFTSLNHKLDEITNVGEICYRDLNNIFEYYSKIKNLFNKHKGYFQNAKELKKRLDSVELLLYNRNFLKDLNSKRPEAKSFQGKVFRELQEIFSVMTEDFTIPELIPKPVKKDRELWQDEKDIKKKQMYKTVELMFENV
jgi:hypothetical protein